MFARWVRFLVSKRIAIDMKRVLHNTQSVIEVLYRKNHLACNATTHVINYFRNVDRFTPRARTTTDVSEDKAAHQAGKQEQEIPRPGTTQLGKGTNCSSPDDEDDYMVRDGRVTARKKIMKRNKTNIYRSTPIKH